MSRFKWLQVNLSVDTGWFSLITLCFIYVVCAAHMVSILYMHLSSRGIISTYTHTKETCGKWKTARNEERMSREHITHTHTHIRNMHFTIYFQKICMTDDICTRIWVCVSRHAHVCIFCVCLSEIKK